MSTIANLMVKIDANTSKLESAYDKVSKKSSSLVKSVAKISTVGVAAIGTLATYMGGKGLKEFTAFEKGMNEVFTLIPDASDKAMGEMEKDVKDFSKEFGVLPDKSIPALYQALSAGVPRDNVFEFMETAQKAAKGGVTELETAVDGLTSVVNAFGEENISASEASDLMFTAVKNGKTTFDELSNSLFNVNPIASALGVNFEDITGAMASMTSQGTPTRIATTQMRQLLVELSKSGGEAATMFESMAGQTFKQFIDSGGNVAGALKIMEDAAKDNGVQINDLFGSVEAGNAALALSGDNMAGYEKNLADMANSAGATETAFGRMDTGIASTMDKIKASVKVAMVNVGERLAPTFERFADWLYDNMPAIENFIVNAFDVIVNIVTTVADVFDTYLRPILQTIFEWIQTHMPQIKETTSTVFGVIYDVVSEVWGFLKDNILPIFKAVYDSVKEKFPAIQSIAESVFGVITNVVTTAWNIMKDLWNFIEPTFPLIGSVIETAGDVIFWAIDGVVGIFEKVTGAIEKAYNWLTRWNDKDIKDKKTTVTTVHRDVYEGKTTSASGRERFATGTNYVPRDMLAYLHKGEAVVTATQNRDDRLGRSSHNNKAVNVIVELDGYAIAEAIGEPMADIIRVKGGLRP